MRSVGCRGPDRCIFRDPFRSPFQGGRSDHIRSILQSPPNTGGRLRSGGALTGCVPGVSRSDHIRSIRSGPCRPEGCESCTSRAAAPFPFRGGNIEGRPAGGGPGFSRDGRHTSGHGSESGRAARAVRGRGGRLRAALWRLRDALRAAREGRRSRRSRTVPARRFPGGMLLPHILRPVEELRVIWRVFRAGGVPGMLRYVAGRPRRYSSVRCFGMVRNGSPCFASG